MMSKLEDLKLASDEAGRVYDEADAAWYKANDAMDKAEETFGRAALAREKAFYAYRAEQNRINKED
tara:strand:- start:5046 stop:5243 length:198 start_codon:yes stop_codon:yes gene_type:complete